MTTEEAKDYLIKTNYPIDQIMKADVDDVDVLDCEIGDWICISEFEGESDAVTAVSLAESHQFSSNPERVEEWLDFMMQQ